MGRLCHGQKTGPDQEEDKSVSGIATWFCYLKKPDISALNTIEEAFQMRGEEAQTNQATPT